MKKKKEKSNCQLTASVLIIYQIQKNTLIWRLNKAAAEDLVYVCHTFSSISVSRHVISPVSHFHGRASWAAAAQFGLVLEYNPTYFINTQINLEMTQDS